MNERRMQFGVGVMVFATMIIGGLLAMVNEPMTSGWFPWGKGRYQIGIQLREAPGVGPNTPIRKNGILIGRVKSIEDQENGIVVHAYIDGDRPLYAVYQPHVRASVLGDATIDFVTQPLPPGAQPVPDGTVFRGAVDPNPFDSLARLGDLKEEFASASRSSAGAGDEISKLAKRINTAFGEESDETGRVRRLMDTTERAMNQFANTMTAFNEIFGDAPIEAQRPSGTPNQYNPPSPNRQPPILPQQPLNMQRPAGAPPLAGQTVRMQQTTDAQPPIEGPELRRRLREGLNELPDAVRDIRNSMERFSRTLDLADKNLRNLEGLTEPLGQKGAEIADSIIHAVDGVDRLVEDLNVFVQAVNNREGTVGRLIHDPQVYESLNKLMGNANQVLAQVYELSLRLRPILDDVRVFTDKIAREPGRILTGGVNPSVVK